MKKYLFVIISLIIVQIVTTIIFHISHRDRIFDREELKHLEQDGDTYDED